MKLNLFKGLGQGSDRTKHSWRFQKRKEMIQWLWINVEEHEMKRNTQHSR